MFEFPDNGKAPSLCSKHTKRIPFLGWFIWVISYCMQNILSKCRPWGQTFFFHFIHFKIYSTKYAFGVRFAFEAVIRMWLLWHRHTADVVNEFYRPKCSIYQWPGIVRDLCTMRPVCDVLGLLSRITNIGWKQSHTKYSFAFHIDHPPAHSISVRYIRMAPPLMENIMDEDNKTIKYKINWICDKRQWKELDVFSGR